METMYIHINVAKRLLHSKVYIYNLVIVVTSLCLSHSFSIIVLMRESNQSCEPDNFTATAAVGLRCSIKLCQCGIVR